MPDEVAHGDDSDDEYEFVSVSKNLAGIARAQRAFLNEARKVFKGKQELTEYLLDKESDSELLRLYAWRSICASAVYLARKNIPFASYI